MQHFSWDNVRTEVMNPKISRKVISGERAMVAQVFIAKDAVVPTHHHESEQLTYILEGALKFWIDGREIVVKAGEVLTIPPNMPHRAEALVDTVDLDVFNPPRADWIDKTDEYLRSN